jgi:hypothetical protein
MDKIILKTSIISAAVIGLLAVGNVALASGDCIPSANTYCGSLSTGLNATLTTTVNGVVISPPVPNPVAGVYTSAQSVTLSADGATSIYYTTDGSTPDCSIPTGTLYSGAITVSSSEPIEAVSCYSESSGVASSTVAAYLYSIDPTTSDSPSSYVALSGGGGGGGGSSSGGNSVPTTVGISDFVLLMANWGQPGPSNPADFSGDATVGIQDFVWLMSNWTV